MDTDGDSKVTFEEFFEWWTSKENNLLPLLYIKQTIKKSLTKAENKIKEALEEAASSDPNHAQVLQTYKASF